MKSAVSVESPPPLTPPLKGRGTEAFASPTIAALLIIAVAVATRIVAWWNPVAHVDDQFYLLAGEELLAGRWPYVDVWDRKPLGLFLLYAGIAWIGGGSILGLNLVATSFAAATAWIIRQVGLRFASPRGATLGGLAYLLTIPLVGGQTGQSPVFYNLLIAGAAWLLIDAAEADRPGPVFGRALGAMALCGLAMTIKQISLVEGAYFGLAFLWFLRRTGAEARHLAMAALAMIAVALTPTALAMAAYAMAGRAELNAFIFSTFTSIFLKGGWGGTSKLAGLLFFLVHLTPLLLMAVAGAVMRQRQPTYQGAVLVGWIAAALIGYLAVPHFFDHYALPLAVPLSISAATFFDRRSGLLFFAGLMAFCVIQPQIRDVERNRASLHEFRRLSTAVEQARRGGCLYVGDGPTRLYSVSGACRVTRHLFPDHLNLVIEDEAVGIDTGPELRRIRAGRPAVIVTQMRLRDRYSPAYQQFLASLPADYRVTHVSRQDLPQPLRRVVVWQRKDLADPQS
ncbi:MAG TPA: hypothetical protein VFO12_12835 [Sphingomicrobium sp.]|nr:hypothetical protein [Sphingomicrobium sp.]